MTFQEYQRRSLETALPTARKLTYLIPGLAAEAGEVAGAYAKFVRDDTVDFNMKIRAELGDVLWFVAVTAATLGIPLEEIAEGNLNKLKSRKERGKISGSGDDR